MCIEKRRRGDDSSACYIEHREDFQPGRVKFYIRAYTTATNSHEFTNSPNTSSAQMKWPGLATWFSSPASAWLSSPTVQGVLARRRFYFFLGGLTTLVVGSFSGYLLVMPEIERRRGEIKSEKERKARLKTFIRCLPKIELHAHLTGCVRRSTLEAFARSPVSAATDLAGCFEVFRLMHMHISTLERVKRVAREV